MIEKTRCNRLNAQPENTSGKYILYWMQAAQRARSNHALEYAVQLANNQNLPLFVYFGLTDSFPSANLRHYHFMAKGLVEVAAALASRGISFTIDLTSPEAGILRPARDARIVVVDDGYTRPVRTWRETVASAVECCMIEVATNVLIPVAEVSEKQEYAARTIRPKIHRQINNYLNRLESLDLRIPSGGDRLDVSSPCPPDQILSNISVDVTVGPVGISPGETAAQAAMASFIAHKLERYHELRNDPSLNYQSGLSPYLHFGQYSPLQALLSLEDLNSPGAEAFVEELLVRRELAINFVHYNSSYDVFEGIPDWAQKTLKKHDRDPRPHLYSRDELERAKTHDDYWNAAQKEMLLTGKMHGYMRMYWAKKILQWSPSHREAFDTCLYLNDKYELDGRDANGYCGVSWCFGTHDRPWKEREIFGSVRYMAASGLERKFDITSYVSQVNSIAAE